MSTLRESVTFTAPRFEVITVGAFRKRPGDVLAQVGFGKIFLITKNGVPVAVLSQPPGDTLIKVIDSKGQITYMP